MLQLVERGGTKDCGGTTRRDFLRIGALGLGGLGISGLASESLRAAEGAARKKSVILLFLCGGASHIETFDPKPEAPIEFRSVTGEIQTSVPGLTFGGTFEGLAARADRLAVVRSFAPHGISDHAQAIKHLLTSGDAAGTSIGSRYAAYRAACPEPGTGMPHYGALIEQEEVDSQYMEDRDRMNIGSAFGGLGSRYAAFTPLGGMAEDMQLRVSAERFAERRGLPELLAAVRRSSQGGEHAEAAATYREQAIDVILGGSVRRALDLSDEDPRNLARYDTTGYKVGWTAKSPCSLGHRLLTARRLCQAGCGFVTVGFAGWDNHANDKHPTVFGGMNLLGRPLDRAVSAFLDDVREQGLEDDILLVITSEFGRTPKLQANGGRDHWPGLDLLVFAGGGLRMGQVIGESTSKAETPKGDPLGYPELLGTLWHTLFDVGQLRLQAGVPRAMLAELEQTRPIPQLV